MTIIEHQHLIVRNSKSKNAFLGDSTHDGQILPVTKDKDQEVSSAIGDETASLLTHHNASLSVVRVVESSGGKYMLDFGVEDDPLLASCHINQSQSNEDEKVAFIETESLKHLHVFAALVGIELSSNDEMKIEEHAHHQSPNLQRPFQHHHRVSFQMLPLNIQKQVLCSLLSLEKLFSWSLLTSAREECRLNWKDIHNFLAEVKRSVPFIPTNSEGLLQHIIRTHLTFHQFVTFAKLIERSLQQLPILKMKVMQVSTLSIDVTLKSSEKGTVVCRIACMNANKSNRNPPTAQQMKEGATNNMFASWQCVQLDGGKTTIVRLEGLRAGTVYNTYLHVSRQSSNFPLEFTDIDVANSCHELETQDYDLIDVFPPFDSMTGDEQRDELLASTKDKSVRLKATENGLIIPGVEEEHTETETWRMYVKWWRGSMDVRYDFCMRELIFASKDEDIRRTARQDGIVMSQSRSNGQDFKRWMRAFGQWYYHNQGPEMETTNNDQFQRSEEELQNQSNTQILWFDLSSKLGDRTTACALRPKFQRKISETIAKGPQEDKEDSLREVLVLKSLSFPHNQLLHPSTPSKDFKEPSADTQNELASLPSEHSHPGSPMNPEETITASVDPTELRRVESHEIVKTPPTTQVRNELVAPKQSKSSSRLTIGVVGSVVSFRQRFLRRLSTRIDTCLALTRPKTASSLRGIALFRAKVKLVILLQKISNKPFSSLNDVDIFSHHQIEARSVNSAAVTPMSAKEVDSDQYDESDDDDVELLLMDKAKQHHQDRMSKCVFEIMRARTQEVAIKKRSQEEEALKTAVKAFHSLLMQKSWQCFVDAVKAAKESVEEDAVEEANFSEEFITAPTDTPEVQEVKYTPTCVEDDDPIEFVSHWNTHTDTSFCRINRSRQDVDSVILKNISSNQNKIIPLDEETLSSMRRAKRTGASNLYDVPDYLLRFDNLDEERPIDCFRNQEVMRVYHKYSHTFLEQKGQTNFLLSSLESNRFHEIFQNESPFCSCAGLSLQGITLGLSLK